MTQHAQEQPAITALDRSGGRRIWLARAGWLFIFFLLTAIFIASIPSATVYQRRDWLFAAALPAVWPYISTFTFAAIVVAVRFAALAVFYAVALLIAWRKWNDWFALFVSAALLMVGWGFIFRLESSTTFAPQWLDPFEPYLSGVMQVCFLLSWLLLFFLLPDGRFVPGWSAWFVAVPFFASVPLFTFDWLHRYIAPLNWNIVSSLAWSVFSISFLIAIMAALYFQIRRYRYDSTPVQRQQMKWVLIGLAAQPLPILLGFGIPGEEPWSALFTIFLQLSIVTLLPITIGLAVLRRRLWDVDPLINRTLVYGGLTLMVVLIYIAMVGVVFILFDEASNLLLAALAVGVAALLAQPLRNRLQRTVNRLMYGERDDPVTVIGKLGEQLEHAASPGESLATLVETIGRSLKLPYVAITTREGDAGHIVAAAGTASTDLVRIPLTYQSQQVGELLVAPRGAGESFATAERRLLDNIARQAGAAVYAAQLTGHLQRSREQLVLTREEERRRLQRDLHDGLGPQLATLSMQLDVARRLTAEDAPEAADLLGQLSADTQTAIADIRRLVYELRPPALDQMGLAGALREYAAGQRNGHAAVRVTVEAPDALPPLPAAVEVAAYRIVQEAVANCLRHAGATECTIRLEFGDRLTLRVRDNGRGLPLSVPPGVGLASMRERAAELGGECRIEAAPGGGTQVIATFPLAEDSRP